MKDILWSRVLWTGLIAGMVVNLVDVPNSIWITGPALRRALEVASANPHALMPPYFLFIHIVMGWLITLSYAAYVRGGPGSRAAALLAVAVPVVISRAFGFGFVLLGVFDGAVFLGLSVSLVAGGVLGGLSWAASCIGSSERSPRPLADLTPWIHRSRPGRIPFLRRHVPDGNP